MKNLFFNCFIIVSFISCVSKPQKENSENPIGNFAAKEVIYHVFQRSFYDSNGDNIGDLNGLKEKLDYLQDLGVTSIQLLPLYHSVFYHNYFTDDFYKIDSTLGSMKDYISLVKEIHRRGMKVFMDMETQYVTEDHPWYKSSYNNLKSPYSNYLVWKDSAHTKTETIVMNITSLKGYNGVVKKLIMVNLKNPEVLKYNIKLFSYWLDPNKDGKFDDGVDGFRFDHMMDDLDNKPQMTGLFEEFWKPLIKAIKKVNPKIVNVAEQAEWNSWATDYVTKAGVDRVYSFKLMGGIRSFNKKYLTKMADSAFSTFPPGHHQIIFISNHDLPRIANQVNESLPKLKIAAALNLLLGETPSIYYGQELGMNGKGEWQKWGMTDANEIPDREAFEWYKSDTGKGMALWYKNSGPWWDQRYAKPNDGISLEEEKPDSNSIYNFYKKIIRIKQENPVIFSGKYQALSNDNDSVFSFQRHDSLNAIIVAINLSAIQQKVNIDYSSNKLSKSTTKILNGVSPDFEKNKIALQMPPYGIEVLSLKPAK
ncbi:MAG TPA: alpha-amylase family glycosyl hydrolase [Hanamia sp.]|nr:alpha-amylase family glycosyl hydrolase [Hanamia sp.]